MYKTQKEMEEFLKPGTRLIRRYKGEERLLEVYKTTDIGPGYLCIYCCQPNGKYFAFIYWDYHSEETDKGFIERWCKGGSIHYEVEFCNGKD